MGAIRLEVARDTNRHVRKALPPSLTGFPGEAEIRYYVKATVGRPQFYKENYRGFADFKFLPIEPPKATESGAESYARRQQQFSKAGNIQRKKGLFGKSSPPALIDLEDEPPRFSVDARLPSPPIITCNEPLPLRILVKKLNESPDTIFLQMLQVELIAYTHIRAHDLARSESGSWVIVSHSNMNMPLGDGSAPAGKEWKIDSSMWDRIPLPTSVAPSFDTCNISRTYDLDIRVGLTHGSSGVMKPELIVLPLRMAVQVYSGIAPPQALLDAIRRTPSKASKASDDPPPKPPRPEVAPTVPPVQDEYDDAPPSYEDAMADALGPVDGPRRERRAALPQ
ncbi:arrestin [Histoplasma capsulatum]|uniref:Arrestin n=1 Tax=Ajellomyces capsulatus TaxID=5037 RepID=A0A8A1M8B0_AJECA|nr:arrestin [Histoplasma capsulatum]